MKLPIIIYDIDKNKLSKTTISKSNCFYFYSYQNISVKILSGVATLFSVKKVGEQLVTNEGQEFNDNFGYTLYIQNNKSTVILEITNADGLIEEYTVNLMLDNIIDESNTHYLDILTNKNLPSYQLLKDAIPDDFDESELVKRLLLEFQNILKTKCTRVSIDKFLQFLGFDDEQLTVYSEYFSSETNTYTINPNKLKDIKTGNYHVIYDNYEEDGYDDKNMPIRKSIIQDLSNFTQSLLNAIILANQYFTAEEQSINSFLLSYSSNIKMFPGMTSNASMIFENDVFDFRKNIDINIYSNINSKIKQQIVTNKISKQLTINKSEVKTYSNSIDKTNPNIYVVDSEILDSDIFDETDIEHIERIFGCIIHLDIISMDMFVEIDITDLSDKTNTLKFNKTYITEPINKLIVLKNTGKYRISVYCSDKYNNREMYYYDIEVSNLIYRIDFDVFNSCKLSESLQRKLSLDVDSNSKLTEKTNNESVNYILPVDSVPLDLTQYFTQDIGNLKIKWLTENSEYILNKLNTSLIVDRLTETIPLDLIDNYLSILSFQYNPNYDLKLRIYDYDSNTTKIINYSDIGLYDKYADKLFITVIDVYDRNEDNTLKTSKTPYYFISTNETGIDISKNNYDFVIVNKIDGTILSVYDITNYTKQIPVNHDFPLFITPSTLVLNFQSYISPTKYNAIINGVTYPIIKSIFPYLTNEDEIQYLKLGDIVLCKLNNDLTVDYQDVKWQIFNSFTNEKLFETNDLTLKYRIEENTCYDIYCEFVIDGVKYTINKTSIISSYESKII